MLSNFLFTVSFSIIDHIVNNLIQHHYLLLMLAYIVANGFGSFWQFDPYLKFMLINTVFLLILSVCILLVVLSVS